MIPLGLLSPLNDLAGVLVQQYADDLDKSLETVFQQELAEAKEKGLNYLRNFVDSWGRSNDYKYRVEPYSVESINELLNGKFETIEKLNEFESSSGEFGDNLYVLYRLIFNQNRQKMCCIIETIFINE